MILGLTWQSNYKIECNWNREGKHFITIEGQYLALSIAPHVIQQLAKTKGQYTVQCRSITWITVKTLQNFNNNSLYEIILGRKLPSGILPLDVTHNLNHKQPGKLLISPLNVAHKCVKLPKNTILGSINQIHNVDIIQEISWKKIQDAENEAISDTAQDAQTKSCSLLFQNILIFRYMPTTIASQLSCYRMQTFH